MIDDSAGLYDHVVDRCSPAVALYAVSMAYRMRFYMRMNAREAMHVIELRTSPQGDPAYRRARQRMHRLIAEEAGHAALAATMTLWIIRQSSSSASRPSAPSTGSAQLDVPPKHEGYPESRSDDQSSV